MRLVCRDPQRPTEPRVAREEGWRERDFSSVYSEEPRGVRKSPALYPQIQLSSLQSLQNPQPFSKKETDVTSSGRHNIRFPSDHTFTEYLLRFLLGVTSATERYFIENKINNGVTPHHDTDGVFRSGWSTTSEGRSPRT